MLAEVLKLLKHEREFQQRLLKQGALAVLRWRWVLKLGQFQQSFNSTSIRISTPRVPHGRAVDGPVSTVCFNKRLSLLLLGSSL